MNVRKFGKVKRKRPTRDLGAQTYEVKKASYVDMPKGADKTNKETKKHNKSLSSLEDDQERGRLGIYKILRQYLLYSSSTTHKKTVAQHIHASKGWVGHLDFYLHQLVQGTISLLGSKSQGGSQDFDPDRPPPPNPWC